MNIFDSPRCYRVQLFLKSTSFFLGIVFFLAIRSVSASSSRELKEITIATPKNTPPVYSLNGKDDGAVIELWKLWEKRLGIKLKFIRGNWGETQEWVRTGKADVHAGLIPNEKRSRFLDFGNTVFHVQNAVFYHKSLNRLENFEDLKPYRVGVVRRTFFEEYLRKNQPDLALSTYESFEEISEAFEKGEIKVFFAALESGLFQMEEKRLEDKIRFFIDYSLYERVLKLAVRKGNKRLLNIIGEGMLLISQDEKREIEQRYLTNYILKTKDILIVGTDGNFSPYSYINPDGEPAGLLIDIWKLWAQKTGKAINFYMNDWSGTLSDLKNGKIDIHSGMFVTDKRKERFGFSQPFYGIGSNIFYDESLKGISTLADFKNLRVGRPKGAYQAEFVKTNYPEIKLVELPNIQRAMKLMRNDELDAYVSASVFAHQYLSEVGLQRKITSFPQPIFVRKLRAAVKKRDTALLEIVDQGFNQITDQELIDIEKSWIKEPEDRYFNTAEKSVRFTQKEIEWLNANKVVRLGVENIPPYLSKGDSGTVGIFADYLDIVSSYTGIRFQSVETERIDVDRSLQNKVIDLVPIQHLGERKSYMLSTQPILEENNFIVSRDSDISLNGIQDLKGRKVALIKNTSIHRKWEQENPFLIPFWVNHPADGIKAVTRGDADAFIATAPVINYFISNKQLSNLKVAAQTAIKPATFRFAVRSDWSPFVGILNKVIAQISKEEHLKIYSKWAPVKIEPQVDWKMFWSWVIGISSILGLFSITIFIWNRQLTREVAFRKKIEEELIHSKEAAEAANRAKSEFISNMSHELRTPLNSVLGFSEILEAELNDPRCKSWVTSIQTAGKNLLQLISDLLDLSKIEAGKLEIIPIPVDIKHCLDEIAVIFSQKVTEKNLQLNIESHVTNWLMLDELRIRQILINLVGNAVKFTRHGFINVKASFSDEPDNQLTIIVEDSGIGIALDQQERIFETFSQQLGQDESRYGGTGLGLAITQKIVKQMDGTITVSSTKGAGSCFTVKLHNIGRSASIPQDSKRHISDHDNCRFDNVTILIVEDIELNRELLKGYLDYKGLRIISAVNGEDAVSYLKENSVDLVITDIKMPVMNGYEVADWIKADEKCKKIPVIAITAIQAKEDKQLLNEKFDSYLSKPVSKKKLFNEIVKFVRHELEAQDDRTNEKNDEPAYDDVRFEVSGIKNWTGLISELDNLMLRWEGRNTFSVNQTLEFAEYVEALGKQSNLNVLLNWAGQLRSAAQMFDVASIQKIFSDFPNIILKIKQSADKQ